MRSTVFGVVWVWAAMLACTSTHAAELSDAETRWLQGMWPVIATARASQLALDIVVQPQPTPDLPPLAMAFVDGRCKLVLSMRGNSQAQATLERIAPEILGPVLELMAAHELGHCRRHLDGAWHALPAGVATSPPETASPNLSPALTPALSPALQTAYLAMQATRREEAFADLVGLAWTQQHHPQQYAQVHAWLVAERSRHLVPGSHHDTLAWLGLARHDPALASRALFDAPPALWLAGLLASGAAAR